MKAGYKHFTLEDRQGIEKNLKFNATYTRIGQLVGKTAVSVRSEIANNGGRNNYNAEEAHNRYISLRSNRKTRGDCLTLDERKLIKKHLLLNHSSYTIGAVLKRAKSTILNEINKNGGKENYDPEESHERAVAIRLKSALKTSLINKEKQINPYIYLKNTIESMQMQIDILFETIKELKDVKKN